MRRYYARLLLWAKHRHASKFLAILSFVEASVVPFPPDILLVSMSLGRPQKALYYASITAFFSVLGGIAGYEIGYHLWPLVQDFFLQHIIRPDFFEKVRVLYEDNLFWTVFIAGYTPIPYKIFTISAGVFRVSLETFVLASIFGRGLRFLLIGSLIYFHGRKARRWIRLNLNKVLFGSSAVFVTVYILFKVYF